jgi:hypothetical protein
VFFQKCGAKPYCKSRGIPECILLVTQRITKYPLLLDQLIKLNRSLCRQLNPSGLTVAANVPGNIMSSSLCDERLFEENLIELNELEQSLANVRRLLFEVDLQVAEKEKETRLLQLYNRIDAKSTAQLAGKKFRKSDFLCNGRKLQFETICSYQSSRSRAIDCTLIILSDVLVFLQDTNQKYHFFSPDNKVSLLLFDFVSSRVDSNFKIVSPKQTK